MATGEGESGDGESRRGDASATVAGRAREGVDGARDILRPCMLAVDPEGDTTEGRRGEAAGSGEVAIGSAGFLTGDEGREILLVPVGTGTVRGSGTGGGSISPRRSSCAGGGGTISSGGSWLNSSTGAVASTTDGLLTSDMRDPAVAATRGADGAGS